MDAVINLTRVIQPTNECTHEAMVHFSSPDQRTDVLFYLNNVNTVGEITTSINNLNITSVLGITDLDLYVEFFK